jgi:putative membrane protein
MRATLSKGILLVMALTVPLIQAQAHHGGQFINQALEANAAEIQFARMALNNAENVRVKEFAQMVLSDHTKVFERLCGLRDARMAFTTSNPNHTNAPGHHSTLKPDTLQLTRQNQRTRDELAKLSGAQFDRRFMDVMVSKHRDSIRVFEEQSRAHGVAQQTDPNDSRQKTSGPLTSADLSMDRDTAAFARETLPTLQLHLQTAESIQKELRGAVTN